MGRYMGELDFLLRGLDQSALSGDEALSTFLELQAQHQEQVAKRRESRQDVLTEALEAQQESQQDLMGDFSSLIMAAPGKYSQEQLASQLKATRTLAGVPVTRPMKRQIKGAVEALYGGRQYAPTYKRVDELDPLELEGIETDADSLASKITSSGKQLGIKDIIDEVVRRFREQNGPDYTAARRPFIQSYLYTYLLGGARKRPLDAEAPTWSPG